MFDKWIERFRTDLHIPIALLVFGVTSIMHFWTHADLGPQYVNSLYALYAFLGGHAFVTGRESGKDKGDDVAPDPSTSTPDSNK